MAYKLDRRIELNDTLGAELFTTDEGSYIMIFDNQPLIDDSTALTLDVDTARSLCDALTLLLEQAAQ